MGIVLRGFAPAHLDRLAARAYDRRDLDSIEDAGARAARYAAQGPALSGFVDGTPLFCCGLVKLWPGVAEAWMVTGHGIEAHSHALLRLFLRLQASELPRHGLHRVQASVVEGHEAASRWLLRLGFVHEGRMRAFGPDGRDHDRYALILEEAIPT